MKGYTVESGYMGYVNGVYMLFASEKDYVDYMEQPHITKYCCPQQIWYKKVISHIAVIILYTVKYRHENDTGKDKL